MNDHTYLVLQESLNVAVRMWIDLLSETTFEQRQARAQRCAQVIGSHGDAILYLVPTKKPVKKRQITPEFPGTVTDNVSTAYAFNALAEGLACAAFQPGGVKAFGLHFEHHQSDGPGADPADCDHAETTEDRCVRCGAWVYENPER